MNKESCQQSIFKYWTILIATLLLSVKYAKLDLTDILINQILCGKLSVEPQLPMILFHFLRT